MAMEARICPELRSTRPASRQRAERLPPRLPENPPQTRVGTFCSAYIVGLEADTYRMDDGQHATTALSCLVKPEAGDLVQLFRTDARCFITAVLSRDSLARTNGTERKVEIALAGADMLQVNVPRLQCIARDTIELVAGQSCEIASPQGRVMLTARDLFTIAGANLIQQARTSLTQAMNYSVKALELLHLKGRHQLISAESEIRLDGQYINMG
jgi:hypothetical protein